MTINLERKNSAFSGIRTRVQSSLSRTYALLMSPPVSFLKSQDIWSKSSNSSSINAVALTLICDRLSNEITSQTIAIAQVQVCTRIFPWKSVPKCTRTDLRTSNISWGGACPQTPLATVRCACTHCS